MNDIISCRSLRSMFAEFAFLMAIATFCFAGYIYKRTSGDIYYRLQLVEAFSMRCGRRLRLILSIHKYLMSVIVSTAIAQDTLRGTSHSAIVCTSDELL